MLDIPGMFDAEIVPEFTVHGNNISSKEGFPSHQLHSYPYPFKRNISREMVYLFRTIIPEGQVPVNQYMENETVAKATSSFYFTTITASENFQG